MSTEAKWELFYFMSVEAKLYINGKDRYKTKFGFLMSILSFVSVFIFSVFFLKAYFDNIDVNVLYVEDKTDEKLYMDLNYKPFFFKLADVDGTNVDPRYLTFSVKYFTWSKEKYSRIALETEQCKFEKHLPDPKYKKMFENIDYESHICLKNDKYSLNITEDPANDEEIYFNLYISECTNSTLNNDTCHSKENIKEYLTTANIYFRYYFPDFKIDHYNKKSPLQETYVKRENKIHNDMFYLYNENKKLVKYTSDQGLVFVEINNFFIFGKDESSSVDISLKSSSSVANALSVYTISIVPGKVDYYRRNYAKIQSVIASIGGKMKFIMTIEDFLNKYISSQMFDVDLSNYFISEMSGEDQEENKKKIKNIMISELKEAKNNINNENYKTNLNSKSNQQTENIMNIDKDQNED